eukprot:8948831-Karenia_brevis.AAC.1
MGDPALFAQSSYNQDDQSHLAGRHLDLRNRSAADQDGLRLGQHNNFDHDPSFSDQSPSAGGDSEPSYTYDPR